MVILNNKKLWLVILIISISLNVYAFRIARPPTLSLPLTEDQVNKLNRYLEDVWHLQQGEFNFDVVTTAKNGANNGDIWILMTGAVGSIQFKANDTIYRITP